MPNAGWPTTAGGGTSMTSTQRATGRTTPTEDAASLIPACDVGMGDSSGDDMSDRADLYEVRGNPGA